MKRRFRDRAQAGEELAALLTAYAGVDGVVLGLPRGGVAVAAPVAERLGLSLDAYMVRKLGVPGYEELAMGALASGGVVVWNPDVLASVRVDDERRDAVVAREQVELARRGSAYRGDRPEIIVRGRTMIVVDDGLATGATMSAAVAALKQQEPAAIVVAVPVAPRAAVDELASQVDDIVVLVVPEHFGAVGEWYDDFSPTTDAEVVALLRGDRD